MDERSSLSKRLQRAAPALLWLLGAACLLGAALGPALLGGRGPLWSARYDWRYFETMTEMARRTVAVYHQVPLWNPYSCGGEVGLANPQAMDAAPTFLLVLLLGTAWGLKAAMALYLLLALHGALALGRHLGLGRAAAAVAAVSFGLSGYLAMHLAAGHINFAGVALYPHLLLFFDRAQRRWEWSLPAGALAAWIALLGGTFTPAMAGELLLLWAVASALVPPGPACADGASPAATTGRRLLRNLGLLALLGVVALGLSAARMLPTLEFILDHPRPPFRRTPDMTTIWSLVRDLTFFRDFGPVPGRKYWSHEYTARLPLLALPLALLTLVPLWPRRPAAGAAPSPAPAEPGRRPRLLMLWGLAVSSALLAMGNFSPVAPWSLLQKLPVLRDLRVPARHLVLVTLFLALLAGFGAQHLEALLRRRSPGRAARWLGGLLVLLCAADAAYFFQHSFRDVFTMRLEVPAGAPRFFHVQGHWSQMRELMVQHGYGVLGCDEEAPLQRAQKLDIGDVPQERLSDPAAGQVVAQRFTPGRRDITVELVRPGALLLINSNWNEHFRADTADGSGEVRVTQVSGRLAVDLSGLPPGRHTVVVRYAPRSFFVGCVVSAVSVPLCLFLFAWRRRRAAGPPR